MNVSRHALIAKTRGGGIELLTAALRDVGVRDRDVQSLEVGNWLRDYSQVVDPVVMDPVTVCGAIADLEAWLRRGTEQAFAVVEREVLEAVDVLLDSYDSASDLAEALDIDLPDIADPRRAVRAGIASLRVPAGQLIDQTIEGARRAVDGLLLPRPPLRRPVLFEAAASIIRVLGYLEHVHPARPGADPRMDLDIYAAVFDEMFTQYWPHEHLDRPPHGSWYRSETAGTMYAYLDEHLTILAGELAELDRDWAHPTFDERSPLAPTAHAIQVAKLARCMHKVEDFFAHSTFVDLLATRDDGMRRKLSASSYLTWLHALRLRRAVPHDADGPVPIWPVRTRRARSGAVEPLLVTGYFDSIDSLVSISHVLESKFGFKPSDPARRAQQDLEVVAHPVLLTREVMFEFGEMLGDPKRAFEDTDNKLAAHVKDAYGHLAEQLLSFQEDPAAWRAALERRRAVNDRVLQTLLRDPALVEGLPAQVLAWLTDALTWFAQVYRVGRAGYGLYELLRDLFKLADLPAAIADAIRSAIPEFIGDRVRNAIAFHVQQVIYNAVGSARPGSHSLLAKDTDTSDPFAEEALLLARVAHRAIIHPLVDLDARRSIPAGQHTDWDTYVRLVLRHPLTEPRPARWRAAAPRWWETALERGQIFDRRGEVGPAMLETLPTVDTATRDQIISDSRAALADAEAAYQPLVPPRSCVASHPPLLR